MLERLVERIEAASWLDPAGARLNALVSKVVRPGMVEDTLSGTPTGHPAHPPLVTVPIGAWTSALVLDATGQQDAARTLVGLGCVTALPAAVTGASDWLSTDGAERRVGLVHAAANDLALAAFTASWFARRSGHATRGRVLAGVGAGLLTAGGWLGGHLAYAQGVGVDTTAFQKLPSDWTPVTGLDPLPGEGQVSGAEVDEVPILIARRGGRLVALADRCSHRGAPLHEGRVEDGCIRCPWHDSVFSLDDGAVVSGPAVRPQPVLEARETGGTVEVRRIEYRALRKNVVGH